MQVSLPDRLTIAAFAGVVLLAGANLVAVHSPCARSIEALITT
ncbi:MAG: hypothetical protein ACR2KQ_09335 [Actinomycetota bacterium]